MRIKIIEDKFNHIDDLFKKENTKKFFNNVIKRRFLDSRILYYVIYNEKLYSYYDKKTDKFYIKKDYTNKEFRSFSKDEYKRFLSHYAIMLNEDEIEARISGKEVERFLDLLDKCEIKYHVKYDVLDDMNSTPCSNDIKKILDEL